MNALKTILIGLAVTVVTGGAVIGGAEAIGAEKEKYNAAKEKAAYDKRAQERYEAEVSYKGRFGRNKKKIVIVDGNGNYVSDKK